MIYSNSEIYSIVTCLLLPYVCICTGCTKNICLEWEIAKSIANDATVGRAISIKTVKNWYKNEAERFRVMIFRRAIEKYGQNIRLKQLCYKFELSVFIKKSLYSPE